MGRRVVWILEATVVIGSAPTAVAIVSHAIGLPATLFVIAAASAFIGVGFVIWLSAKKL